MSKVLFIPQVIEDSLCDLTLEGLSLVLKDKLYTYPWIDRVDSRRYTIEEIRASWDEIKYVFLGSSYSSVCDIANQFDLSNKIVILIDGLEHFESNGPDGPSGHIKYDLVKKYNIKYYFKRECVFNRKYESWVYPLPFSISEKILIPLDYTLNKEYDIVFRGIASNVQREQLVNHINNTLPNISKDVHIIPDFPSRISTTEYLKKMLQSKISLSIRGAGFDTTRFWIIPYTKSLLLSTRPTINIPNCFEHGTEAIYFNNKEEMREQIEYYLIHEEKRNEIINNAYNKLLTYHTTTARAKYILETIKYE